MLSIFRRATSILSCSKLFNENTFYQAFRKDLAMCKHEVLIESPFITTKRVCQLIPDFQKAISRGVRITVNTRDPHEHEQPSDAFAVDAIAKLESVGVEFIYTGKHHRKLAVLDRSILWEGSLNILSQYDSCEIMRRIKSPELSRSMIQFIEIDKYLK